MTTNFDPKTHTYTDEPVLLDVLDGPHYHPWILGYAPPDHFGIEHLVYGAPRRAYAGRQNANRQGKKWADPALGSDGYMVRKCAGGPSCPSRNFLVQEGE